MILNSSLALLDVLKSQPSATFINEPTRIVKCVFSVLLLPVELSMVALSI